MRTRDYRHLHHREATRQEGTGARTYGRPSEGVDLSEPYLVEDNCGTVYVPQLPLTSNGGVGSVRPRIDLSPAEKYGKLVYLCDWENMDGIDTTAVLFELRAKM